MSKEYPIKMIKTIVPNGWPCTLKEAPEGMFVTLEHPDLICFKTEYSIKDEQGNYRVKAFNSRGEYFCGNRDKEIVQPVQLVLCEDDENE